ncbi:hypothetical protein AG1IA_06690 [Rhizoctonia solani AG-1 IA]|uniref:Nucleoplasmin-like domain-containing protein n=1 Tax=Thanatephorus cucumeris (strain AG1-IA) TaxID=983506 RepID=L8WSE2_THACA|nr:hypothetical protein AG1IA_06690 [Rhizoctonia solani AG-1 IA]
MAISVAVWSQDLEPGKRNLYTVENDIRISGASLAADLADPTGRTVVEVVIKIPEDYEFEDEADPGERPPMHKFVLCVEQQPLDLVLPEGEEVEFVVKGKNHVHLYGNYIQQNPGDEDSDEDDDEDEFDLDEVPSDVELGLEDDDEEAGDSSRFEEIEDTPASVKTGKRAREDEEMADQRIVLIILPPAAETSTNLSKKEKKRAKKLKNEAGKAAPAPATTTTTTTTTTTSPTKKDKPVEKKEVAKPAEKKDGGKKDGEKKKKVKK